MAGRNDRAKAGERRGEKVVVYTDSTKYYVWAFHVKRDF